MKNYILTKPLTLILSLNFCLSFVPFLSSHEVMEETLQKPINLVAGLGHLHHPVTTQDPEAQQFFDQGLTLIYAFNHDAAYRSFQQAAEIDPEMAMAYWGMALSLGSNINMKITPERERQAYQLIQKALSLTSHVTESEKRYIQALATRYSNDSHPNFDKQAVQYRNAMKALMRDYPDDLDAATLYVDSALTVHPWDQWTLDGQPKPGTLEIVATLESILKRDPMHMGANHYYIHTVEASNYPERALMSAERLRNRFPASGHLMHMPSHIYILVGDYHLAALCNEKAVEADKAYIREYGIGGIYPVHYMSHNLYFLSRAYSLEGRFNDAKRAADELSDFYTPHFHEMPDLEYYQPTGLFVLLRFHHWQDILDTEPPPQDMKISTALWHFARAMAYAALGQQEAAKDEEQIFETQRRQISSASQYGYNKADKILLIAHYVLQAQLAESQGQWPRAIDAWHQAVVVQDTLRYNEPPDWYASVRESLGAALLKTGQWRQAERVFREDLDKHPRNGRSLFGLLYSLRKQQRETDAFWIDQAFRKAWHYSDQPLTLKDL